MIEKKRKVFSYSPTDSHVSYTNDVVASDWFDDLARYNESKKATKKITIVEDTSARTSYVELVGRSLQEFNRLQRLVEYLKRREVLGLQTCDKASVPAKKQTTCEKIDRTREGYEKARIIISNGLHSARALVAQRRARCADGLLLRKNWRLITDASPPKQIITHDQAIAVDCSDLSIGGDSTGLPEGLLRLTGSADEQQPSLTSPEHTLQVSLLHSQAGLVCSQSLWSLLYEPTEDVQRDLAFRCCSLSHDKLCRQVYRALTGASSVSSPVPIGCCASVGSDVPLVDRLDENLSFAIIYESLYAQVLLTSVSRAETRICLSESLVLAVSLVPLEARQTQTPSPPLAPDGSHIYSACRLLVSHACLCLCGLLPKISSRIRRPSPAPGRGLSLGWTNIREVQVDYGNGGPLVAFVRAVQHRLMVCRAIICLQKIMAESLQFRVVALDQSPCRFHSVLVLHRESVTSAVLLDHCSLEVIGGTLETDTSSTKKPANSSFTRKFFDAGLAIGR